MQQQLEQQQLANEPGCSVAYSSCAGGTGDTADSPGELLDVAGLAGATGCSNIHKAVSHMDPTLP